MVDKKFTKQAVIDFLDTRDLQEKFNLWDKDSCLGHVLVKHLFGVKSEFLCSHFFFKEKVFYVGRWFSDVFHSVEYTEPTTQQLLEYFLNC